MAKGVGISSLNPKVLLLYFSLFPQFIRPANGWPVSAQIGLLGALHMAASPWSTSGSACSPAPC